MNLDEIFGLEESNPMVRADTVLLLGCVLAAAAAAWFCAYRYRDTYDIEKSIRLYLPFAAAGIWAFSMMGLPLLFAIGAQLCGFVILLLISNRMFRN